jgi:hypothetical protein
MYCTHVSLCNICHFCFDLFSFLMIMQLTLCFLCLFRHCGHIINGLKRRVDMKNLTVFSKHVNWFQQLNIRILSRSTDCPKFCGILTISRKVNLFQQLWRNVNTIFILSVVNLHNLASGQVQFSCSYTRRRMSPSLGYVTERGEGKTKDGGEIQGSIGFFPHALSLGYLPLPTHISVCWPPMLIFNRQRSSEICCCIYTYISTKVKRWSYPVTGREGP